ncbi:MAG: UbiA family prenyltransferase [Candidatus Eisenbacteria bacterium]
MEKGARTGFVASVKRVGTGVADRTFLLRPLVMVPAVTFFLLGYRDAQKTCATELGNVTVSALAYALLMGVVYVVNQIFDTESDRHNEKLFLLPRRIIGKTEAALTASVLAVLTMVYALWVGGSTPLLWGASLGTGLCYSVPPLAFKRFFPLDLLSNGLGYGVLAYCSGWSLVATPGPAAVARAAPFALSVAAVFILTALADREGDERSGFRTTGVVVSPGQGTRLALLLIVAAFVVALVVRNNVAAIGSLCALPFFGYASLKVTDRSIAAAYRCSSAVFVLIVGVVFPTFLIVVVGVTLCARLYYSKRFSLDYPSVAGR